MFCESIAALFLVGFISPGQSTTTLAPSDASATPSATHHQTPNAAPSNTMTAMVQPNPTMSIVPSAQTTTSEPPANTTTSMASSPSSLSTSASITSPANPSCVFVRFIAERTWNASLMENMSVYNETSEEISKAVKYFFNDSSKYENVEVSEHKYSDKDSVTLVEMKLCLVVKTSDGPVVDAVFIEKLKTGYLFEGFKVRKDSAEFEPRGVEFTDWKAKDGDCTKCEGAGGEFTIEGRCVSKESSCKGLKNTKMTKDCVTFCDSSAETFTISFLVLVLGIFFSFSFQ